MKITLYSFVATCFAIGCAHGADVTIQITHWNDISAQIERFQPLKDTNGLLKECTNSKDAICHGGFEYVVGVINENTNGGMIKPTNILKLTSGNLVGGESGWLSVNKWDKFGQLVNKHYKPHVMSLGIKDFGAGIAQTVTYVNNTYDYVMKNGPEKILSNIMNCNDFTDTSEKDFCSLVAQHATLTVNDDATNASVAVGVVSYINPTVEKLGSPGNLHFEEVVKGLDGAIRELKDSGVKFIIALGEGSLDMAKSVIDTYGDVVKVVLYGRALGASKDMTGSYPENYKGSYIGTAGRYGSSVGKMVIRFDSNTGSIKSTANSLLVPVDEKVIADPQALTEVTSLRSDVVEESNIYLGKTHVTIHGGEVCWSNECNLGNLMADAAVHCVYKNDNINYKIPEGLVLGIWHGGALFYDIIKQKSSISRFDTHKWLPFHNNVHVVSINGSSLRLLFEASATALDSNTNREPKWGQFFQISSGMEVTYTMRGGNGYVEKIRVIKDEDTIPKMVEITDADRFLLAMPSFIREGRSIFDFVKTKNFFLNIPTTPNGYFSAGFDDTCLAEYITAQGTLVTGFEERIYIDSSPGGVTCKNNKTKHVLLTLFITLLIFGGIFIGWKFLWPRFNNRHHSFP